jgi:thiol:disulfide interchange protein DsbD
MNLSKLLFYILIFNIISLTSIRAQDTNTDPLIVKVLEIKNSISVGENFNTTLELNLPDGYHAYEDKFKVQVLEPNGFKVSTLKLAPIKEWYDKFSKKNRTGVEKKATMTFVIEAPAHFVDAKNKLVIELSYQACTDSFCLFPKTKDISIPVSFVGITTTSEKPIITKSLFTMEAFSELLNQSWWLALIVAFVAGILTSFTPCIFPMIPITIAILTKDSEKRSRLNNFLTSVVYVHGIATTYSIFGLIAAYTGSLFGSLLSNTYFLIFVCILFLIMAFSMYGAFDIQVPSFLRNKFGNGTKHTGFVGAYISGLFAGLVASPCVGPVLVAILTYVSTQKSPLFGFFLLFSYAIGMGLIFIVLGAFSELAKKLPRSGPWMEFMKFALGSLMLSAFYYYLQFLVSERVYQILLGSGLIILSSLYGTFMPILHPRKRDYLRKGMMQTIFVLGLASLVLGVFDLNSIRSGHADTEVTVDRSNWLPYSEENLTTAINSSKPIIVDFYADWCAACHELDKYVFSSSEFKMATSDFTLLKFDATKDSAVLTDLKKKYQIKGLPTIIFYNSKGELQQNLTLTEYEKKEVFLKRLENLK